MRLSRTAVELSIASILWLASLVGARAQALPHACNGTTTVVTGGTAVTTLTGPVNGGYIVNPATTADQGVSPVENMYVDMTTTATTTGNGTNTTLLPGQALPMPSGTQPISPNFKVSVNAPSSGHKFTCVSW